MGVLGVRINPGGREGRREGGREGTYSAVTKARDRIVYTTGRHARNSNCAKSGVGEGMLVGTAVGCPVGLVGMDVGCPVGACSVV
jgi:hypothetical protein